MPPRPFSNRVGLLAWTVLAIFPGAAVSDETPPASVAPKFRAAIAPFVTSFCIDCHGPTKQEGKLRLDNLIDAAAKNPDELAVWSSVYEQLALAQMPPADARQPTPDQVEKTKTFLQDELARVGVTVGRSKAADYPSRGNLVDHAALFDRPSTAAPATPARLWRLSPFAYREFADDLTGGRLIVKGGPAVRAKMIPLVTTPFGLTDDPGFRDYAFRYPISGSESQQLAMNARIILSSMLEKRPRYTPPKALTAIADGTDKPTADQIRAAVRHVFGLVLYREPTEEELTEFVEFTTARIQRHGNHDGLTLGLAAVFLHPEAVFRSEFGTGQPDAHGRVMLAPTELAVAIAYALSDRRPDATLLAAARSGKLTTRDDVRREVTRRLDLPTAENPRILRFFQEYFGYDRAPEVFKDPADVKSAGINNKYNAEFLVTDTDRLVIHILEADRDVLKELLTTNLTFVNFSATQRKGNGANSPFGTRPGQTELHKHYNFDAANWSDKMPFQLPKDQRAGILTQPAWLIAHSANTENHAIHRGKWVRERMLGGSIPDTPITVEAKLPDEPDHTLRHRMRVTREAYCFKCHQQMDPLGLPFEMYDHFGQYRTLELGKPVDTTGAIVASGDPKLDGNVVNAVELIRKLADSERVHQVFVRHAFRYWMGRNETLDDAPTLQAAYQAYKESHGSMKALIGSLLTSDSFLYRRPVTAANTP